MSNNKEFKFDRTKFGGKYLYTGLMAFFVLTAVLLVFFIFFKIETIKNLVLHILDILQPIIVGVAIAYLVNPIMSFFYRLFEKLFIEKWHFRKKGKSVAKFLSIFIALFLFILIIGSIIYLVVPQLITSIMSLTKSLPGQIDNSIVWITDLLKKNESLSSVATALLDYEKQWIQNDLLSSVTVWAGYVASGVLRTAGFVWDTFVGVIVAVYLLSSKSVFKAQAKKILNAFFNQKHARIILQIAHKSNSIFSGFINGKLLDSFIIGILCFIGLTILKMPYAVLVAAIIGVTNIIPFFGPYIGAVPSALLILLTDPIKGIYFIIFITLLQAFDGNILGPKILGNSTGLSPFWVVFAIVLGGGLFGLLGMLVGVPVFAVIYYLSGELVDWMLRKRNLSTDTAIYASEPEITAIEEEKTE